MNTLNEKLDEKDVAKVGTYRNHDVWLIPKGGNWYIAFGSVENQQYWLEALNRILDKTPEYKFITEQGIEVDMLEMKDLMKRINYVITLI